MVQIVDNISNSFCSKSQYTLAQFSLYAVFLRKQKTALTENKSIYLCKTRKEYWKFFITIYRKLLWIKTKIQTRIFTAIWRVLHIQTTSILSSPLLLICWFATTSSTVACIEIDVCNERMSNKPQWIINNSVRLKYSDERFSSE